MSGPSYERVLDRLERVKGTGDAVVASCPVPSHGQGRGDRNPSLSVRWEDGKTLLNCQTDCHVQDIVLALGLEWPDLFDEPLKLGTEWGVKVAEWVYAKPDGSPYFLVERWQNAVGKRFVQRVHGNVFPPGHARAGQMKPGYPPGFKPCLFNLPAVLAEARAGGTVYVVEGEKSVSAARQLGLVATTGPNGAKAWQSYYADWLAGASQVFVVCDNDNDGRRYASEVVASIRVKGLPCRAVGVAVDQPKADLYDHVVAGYTADDLVPLNLNRLRPDGNPISDVMHRSFAPVRWVVPSIIPAGLSLLGGTVKMGKSMVALDIALGVGVGGVGPVTRLPCQFGSVLYLTLDNDTLSRIKARSLHLLGRPIDDLPIEVHTTWPVGTEAVAACQEWVDETDNPLLVVMDTMVRAEPTFEGDGRGGAYSAAVNVLSRWSDFAQANNIGVLAVHHTRKNSGQLSEGEDWIDRFLGSRGLVATAQTLLMIEADRGSDVGVLHVAGRDVRMQDMPLMRQGWSWQCERPPTVVGL